MWSKNSNSVVENSLVYLMRQKTVLNLFKLPSFSQDTTIHTNVSTYFDCTTYYNEDILNLVDNIR